MPKPDVIDDLRRTAAEAVREQVLERRAAKQEMHQARDRSRKAALAAVEGVELIDDTLRALPDLPPAARDVLSLAVEAAWQRLADAGLRRFGQPGEPLDRARHEVVQQRGRPAPGRGVVSEVLSPGVLFHEEQLRAATVVAQEE